MRLRDLDAQFLNDVTTASYTRSDDDQVIGAQGILFQCPSCAAGKDVVADDERAGRRYVVGAHYIEVLFSNPVGASLAPADAGPVGADHTSHPRWTMSGSSLDDLTITPSINCDIPGKNGEPSVCKFHGFVKNGDAA